MKRVDCRAFPNDLVRLIEENPIGRNEDLACIIELLDTIEGPYSLFLDSEWGSGKTFFVKQLELVLQCLNDNLQSFPGLRDAIDDDASLSRLDQQSTMLPIYYNAWEHDFWDDPIVPLVQVIACDFDISSEVPRDKETADRIADIIDAVLKPLNFDVANGIRKAVTSENLIQRYRDCCQIRDHVENLVSEILPNRAKKLLLIIDELDRCRPTFALKLLEEVKTLFDDNRVTVLYSINLSQISYTIEHAYGQGFDAARYMLRFYDEKITLAAPNNREYLGRLGIPDNSYRNNIIAHEMADALGMTLRDMNRYYVELKQAQDQKDARQHSPSNDAAVLFAEAGLVPVLLAVKVMSPSDFQSITHMRNHSILMEYVNLSKEAVAFLDGAYGHIANSKARPESADEIDEARREMMKNYCELIWNTNTASQSYRDAHDVLLERSFCCNGLRYINELLR